MNVNSVPAVHRPPSFVFHHIVLIISILTSIFCSTTVLLTRRASAINLKDVFTGKFLTNNNQDARSNNNYDELIASLGEDGYRELVMVALGLEVDVEEGDGGASKHGKKGALGESYPAQHPHVQDSGSLVGKQEFYEAAIQGCRDYYYANPKACNDMEYDRIQMNLIQPKLMVNFTALGFSKQRLPPHLVGRLQTFWETSQDEDDQGGEQLAKKEMWNEGNTYTNHWQSPTYMLNIPSTSLHATGDLRTEIYQTVEKMIHQWINGDEEQNKEEFVATSLYGIRIYKEGCLLAPHVDRLPLVTSAIINVAQDVEEDWPLEVYGHDGKIYNITMKPGDILLYESHSVIHGRPFPLKGKYYANIFVHFEPKGYTQRFYQSYTGDSDNYQPAKRQYNLIKKNKDSSIRDNKKYEIPFYIEKGGMEQQLWKAERRGRLKVDVDNPTTTLLTVHQAAARGKLNTLASMFSKNANIIHEKDQNGWQPIHEASRGGHTAILKFLIDNGADINARPQERGGTPLYHAKKNHGSSHSSVVFLESHGAIEVGPSKKDKHIKVTVKHSKQIELTVHQAAAKGALSVLQALVEKNPELVHEKDQNGWQPIHEAARGGHTAILKFLIDRGADVNVRPNGTGGTPLYYAKEKRGPDHESVKFLRTYGALDVGPFF